MSGITTLNDKAQAVLICSLLVFGFSSTGKWMRTSSSIIASSPSMSCLP